MEQYWFWDCAGGAIPKPQTVKIVYGREMSEMIYTVTLNPALDKTVEVPNLKVDAVNRITLMRTDPGGKGINVSKVIAKLGGGSVATGILGGNTGRAIRESLAGMGIELGFVFVDGETRTNLKIIDPVNHQNTDINEPGVTVTADELDELLGKITGRLQKGDIVVLSGSIPAGCPSDIYKKWTEVFSEKGVKVILDADGEQFALGITASPYLIKPNNHELSAMVGKELKDPEELQATAKEIMDKYRITKVVVSMGGAGALYVTADETIYAEAVKVPVGSTVGAGDSVVAALAVAEEAGMSLTEAARLSTATGAANVMCSGTQAAEYETVQELMPKVVLHRM
ncbi:MAG: 1-phosphofructokinase [Clostridiales bacterium]|nr:1-phosphofructokinase [Clostridiales bacterium]